MVIIGPKELEAVPFQAVNELPQVRTVYDPAKLAELADAIRSGEPGAQGSAAFTLVSALSVGRFTPTEAGLYITEHGEFYEIPRKDRVAVEDLARYQDDVLILIAGHRRRRAIRFLLDEMGIHPTRARVAAHIQTALSFDEALYLQLRENTYEKPDPCDEARAIERAYQHQSRLEGSATNIRHLASELGFSETKVRDALQFASLPSSIQKIATDGVLSYTVTRQLKPLYDAFLARYKYEPLEQAVLRAEAETLTFCMVDIEKTLSGKSDTTLQLAIANKTKEVLGQAMYQSDELFFMDQTPLERFGTASRKLAGTALRVVEHVVQSYPDDELERARRAIEAEQARRQSTDLPKEPLF